jgi:hypothetical protein
MRFIVANTTSDTPTTMSKVVYGPWEVWAARGPLAALFLCSQLGLSGMNSHTLKMGLNPNPCAAAAPQSLTTVIKSS